NWTPWYPTTTTPTTTPTIDLPTYPFQRQPYWLTARPGSAGVPGSGTAIDHPVLSSVAPLADGGAVLSGRVPTAGQGGWLSEHVIAGTVLLPGTALLELAFQAAEHTGSTRIEELLLEQPLLLHESAPLDVQVVVGAPGDDGARSVHIYTRPASGQAPEWVRHATATLTAAFTDEPAPDTTAWPPPGAQPVDLTGFYDRATADGYDYGPTFQGLQALWHHGDDLLADITLPTQATDAHTVHPALLDAALHPLIAVTDTAQEGVWLPFSWNGVTLHATGATQARVRISRQGGGGRGVTLTDGAGRPILTAEAVTTRPARLSAPRQAVPDGLFALRWTPAAPLADRPADADLSVVYAAATRGDDELASVQSVLTLLQEWLAEPRPEEERLVVLTRGAAAVDEESAADPVAAAVAGLVRSAQSEHPGRFVLLDLDAGTELPADPGADPLIAEAVRRAVELDEPQLALRGGRILAPRLVRAPASASPVPLLGREAWRLDAAGTGGTATLDGVAPVPFPEAEQPLAPGRVRIAVRAAGVNFRDVLISLGMVPDQTRIGGEGAGVVLEVAPDVTSVVPGERVLIHAATGGVGTAAVQIAQHIGAEVYATASPAKHTVLEAMGIDEAHRASSRDLDFEDAFREAAGSMDVVLNSLADAYIDASLRLLGQGGRFLEMGKTDIRDPEQVAKDFGAVDYRVYDLVSDAGPERVARMLGTLVELFERGALVLPPVQTWPLAQVRQALRHMSQAKHTGKLVLTVPPALDRNGTVLITGG
uniref:polyketide synthase dehydratase domain-containing protein n=1 Tax=Streptomyces sp. NRRL F-5123 TaxID=1463856 RepID=UPI0004E20CD2